MNIVTTIVTAITEIVSGSAEAIVQGVEALLFTSDGNLNNTAIVIFTLFGLGAGFGLMYVIFNLVTRR